MQQQPPTTERAELAALQKRLDELAVEVATLRVESNAMQRVIRLWQTAFMRGFGHIYAEAERQRGRS